MTVTKDKGGTGLETALARRVAELAGELLDAEEHCRQLERELEDVAHAARLSEWAQDDLRTVREFVADVQRGIRDLSEYEDVCGP